MTISQVEGRREAFCHARCVTCSLRGVPESHRARCNRYIYIKRYADAVVVVVVVVVIVVVVVVALLLARCIAAS